MVNHEATRINDDYDIYGWSNSEQLEEVEKSSIESLNSDTASNVLPYLTLKYLSDDEKAELIKLSDEATDLVLRDDRDMRYSAFDFYDIFGNEIANISKERAEWEDFEIPPKTQEARKLFCSCLFEKINELDNDYDRDEIRRAFFSSSPDFTSYCGDLSDSLEMLSIAERSEYRGATHELCGEIVYDYSFADFNDFDKVLENASPTEQLRLMPVIFNISEYCDPDDYSNRALDKISRAFENLAHSDASTPLVKLVAESLNEKIDRKMYAEWVDIDMSNPEHVKIMERYEKDRLKKQKEQEEIHKNFPNLPENSYATMIAPDIAGAFSGKRLNILVNKDGETVSLLKCQRGNKFDIAHDTANLIIATHDPNVKALIDERLGLQLEKIPLASQIQLSRFMLEADNGRFDKLCSTMKNTNKKLRLKLAENFLAADFGDDFGDSLLTIANSTRLSNNEKAKILDDIESCRESVKKVTRLYKGVDDGKFAKEYARAANERLTDAVKVFEQIAERDSITIDLDWAGEVKFDYKSAIEALDYEMRSLEIISGTLDDVKSGKAGAFAEVLLEPEASNQRLRRTFYNFYSPDYGYVLLYTRPEGSHSFDPTIEYGKERSRYNENSVNAGVEASISLITNPIDPFSLPNPFRPDMKAMKNPNFYDPSKMNKVSAIRLDREGRAPGVSADDPNRDPVNPVGTISVDLSAINDRRDTPSGKIARLFSAGNKIRNSSNGGETYSLNHNTNWFSQDKYGTARGFEELVNYIDDLAINWCDKRKPDGKAENFTEKMRAKNKNRGKMARNIA